jgi:hypothetical protein
MLRLPAAYGLISCRLWGAGQIGVTTEQQQVRLGSTQVRLGSPLNNSRSDWGNAGQIVGATQVRLWGQRRSDCGYYWTTAGQTGVNAGQIVVTPEQQQVRLGLTQVRLWSPLNNSRSDWGQRRSDWGPYLSRDRESGKEDLGASELLSRGYSAGPVSQTCFT